MKQYSIYLLGLLFFIANSVCSFAQTIEGTILSQDNSALSFANVLLFDALDSTFQKGTTSTEQGNFSIDRITQGTFFIQVNSLGYEVWESKPIVYKGETIKLEPIRLVTDAQMLDEITVKAEKPIYEQKIDRLVVNVSNSITAAGGTALEILERSPGVVVNRQWNRIGLNGKQGVLIMINNKISRIPADALIQMLSGMSADNIEKIELIHTPPANFEAEGNAGIIHIILKKSADQGFNASISTFVAYGRGEKWGGSGNFNFRKQRINLYGDLGYNFDRMEQFFDLDRSFILDNKKLETLTTSLRDTRTVNPQARIGVDYQWSDHTTMGLLVAYSKNEFKMDAETTARKRTDGALIDSLYLPSDEVNRRSSYLYNFNLEHHFQESHVLHFDVDYVDYSFSNPSNYFGRYYDHQSNFIRSQEQRVRSNTPMEIWSTNLGYRFQWRPSVLVETGAKARTARFINDVSLANKINQTWEFDPDFTSKVKMTEDVLAAYFSLQYNIGEKASLKAGLRYEHTTAKLDSEDRPNLVYRQYGNFFPSVYFSHKVGQQDQIQVSYSRRINRPDFTMLAPFYYFFDPTTLLTGDPTLQPSLTDKINVSYQWKTVQLQLNYSYEQGAMFNFQLNNDPTQDIAIVMPENFDFSQVYNATLTIPLKLTSWMELRNNFSLVHQQVGDTENDQKLEFKNTGWNYNGSLNMNLPRQYAVEISGFYQAKSIMGALVFDPVSQVNLGIQKELPNNWGTIKLSISDMFLGGNWRIVQQDERNDFLADNFFRVSQRIFRLSYSKSLGNGKLKGARTRATSSEEERSRVK